MSLFCLRAMELDLPSPQSLVEGPWEVRNVQLFAPVSRVPLEPSTLGKVDVAVRSKGTWKLGEGAERGDRTLRGLGRAPSWIPSYH